MPNKQQYTTEVSPLERSCVHESLDVILYSVPEAMFSENSGPSPCRLLHDSSSSTPLTVAFLCVLPAPWLYTHTHTSQSGVTKKPVCVQQKCDDSAAAPPALEFLQFCCLQAATLNIAISPFYLGSFRFCFMRSSHTPAHYGCPV